MAMSSDGVGANAEAPTRELVMTLVRVFVATTALIIAYFVFPTDDRDNAVVGLIAVLIAVGIFVAVFWRQLRRIRSSDHPLLRAAEAIVLVAIVFIILMSTVAAAFSASDSGSYSEPLSRLDALYFTVTTLATVGYGDITPTAPETRAFTIIQIVLGVALLGVGLRSLVVMAQNVKQQRAGATTDDPETPAIK